MSFTFPSTWVSNVASGCRPHKDVAASRWSHSNFRSVFVSGLWSWGGENLVFRSKDDSIALIWVIACWGDLSKSIVGWEMSLSTMDLKTQPRLTRRTLLLAFESDKRGGEVEIEVVEVAQNFHQGFADVDEDEDETEDVLKKGVTTQ